MGWLCLARHSGGGRIVDLKWLLPLGQALLREQAAPTHPTPSLASEQVRSFPHPGAVLAETRERSLLVRLSPCIRRAIVCMPYQGSLMSQGIPQLALETRASSEGNCSLLSKAEIDTALICTVPCAMTKGDLNKTAISPA